MTHNPYAPPQAQVGHVSNDDRTEFEYVGFWARAVASLIDSVLMVVLAFFLAGFLVPGANVLLSWILPAAAAIIFWQTRQATPGKMAVFAKVVDAKTGGPLSTGQAIGRYCGYFVSSFFLGLGFLWIAFDARKQGWHDKLAGTVVVRGRK